MPTIKHIIDYTKNRVLPTTGALLSQRWLQLLLAFFAGVVAISIWNSYSNRLFLEQELRKIDSLQIEIKHLNREYGYLKTKADSLDFELKSSLEERDRLKRGFGGFKRPPVDNASDAYNFLKDFAKDDIQ